MDHEVLVGVEINQRTHQIQVKTMMRGKGRHNTYPSLHQAPEAIRGQALVLIREALRRAGYSSLVELETALTAKPVQPAGEAATQEEAARELVQHTTKPKARKTWGDEAVPLDDTEFQIGGG